jgi:hypothetical protein
MLSSLLSRVRVRLCEEGSEVKERRYGFPMCKFTWYSLRTLARYQDSSRLHSLFVPGGFLIK